jgi:hypothetical protein
MTFTINPSLLLLNTNQSFNFVSLPSNMLELSMKYYKILCNNCNSTPPYTILCLVCGEKICYMDTCCKNYGKKKNTYEYIHHNRICGGGDGVFLHLYNGEITFALIDNFVSTSVSVYQNKYGEGMGKKNNITDEYILNEEILISILNDYKSLNYSKHFKLKQNVGLANMGDQDEMEEI